MFHQGQAQGRDGSLQVGCIKCGRCVKSCPADAVTLENDRIHINHKVCLTYGPECGKPAPPRARARPCRCSVRARL
ncbi:MAG: 4Fe-4S dicluster domain-containing protein [Bilophila wadsworthia]